jgi:hypothetical protein
MKKTTKKATKKSIVKYIVSVKSSMYAANAGGYVGVKEKYRTYDLKFAKLFASKSKAIEAAEREHNATTVYSITITSNNRRALKESVFHKRDSSSIEIDYCNQNGILVLY